MRDFDLAPRFGRLRLLYCEWCGAPLVPTEPTETLLSTLTRLSRFGLAAGTMPILSCADTGRPEPGMGE